MRPALWHLLTPAKALVPLALVTVLAVLFPASASAQDLPAPEYTSVNDFAGLLDLDGTRVLDQALIALHDETGVQGTVVTLTDRARYGGHDGLEAFATRLFNDWGVGQVDRNDGFMVLVLRDDREARITLGAGYPASADARAAQIMDKVMLPAFRNGQMSAGITNGTLAVIDQIARPHAQGLGLTPPAQSDPAPQGAAGGLAAMAGLAFGLLFLRRQRRRRRCPECGHSPVMVETAARRDPRQDGGWQVAADLVTRICPACGWREQHQMPTPQITTYAPTGSILSRSANPAWRSATPRRGSRSCGGFGGGSSSGGGASGRW